MRLPFASFSQCRLSAALLTILSAFYLSACSRATSPKNQPGPTAQKQIAPNPCDANAQPPGDISLRVSPRNGQTIFHQGEIIVLTTTYSAKTKKKYSVWGGNAVGTPVFGDGELYCLSPDVGLTDNLLEGAIWPGSGGGGSVALGMLDPATKPFVDDLDLNDPRSILPSGRSLPAGKYSLRVISRRVTPAVKDIFARPPKERIPVISNNVQFEVHADTEWQAQQFAEDRKILDSPTSALWQKLGAIHKLRFLDTEASTRELADHFNSLDDPGGWEIIWALFGSRHRDAAIREMKIALTNPHHHITPDFAKALAALEMQADPRFRLPTADQIGKVTPAKTIDADRAEFDHRVQEYLKLAASGRRVPVG
jgi:hypothetical protein